MTDRLLGLFEKTLDDKNRLVLPPELRNRLDPKAQVVVSRWYDHSIALFEEEEYADFARSLHDQGSASREARLARQEIFGGACLVGIDGQGRMSLPKRLLDGVLMDPEKDRDLVVVGDWNKILIYSGLRYRDLSREGQVNLDDALSQVENSARRQNSGNGEEE